MVAPDVGAGLPYAPIVNAAAMFQAKRSFLDASGTTGVRYLTGYTQCCIVYSTDNLDYQFNGITTDGQFFISLTFKVMPGLTRWLPPFLREEPQFPVGPAAVDRQAEARYYDEYDQWVDAVNDYNEFFINTLEELPPQAFVPTLDLLDNLIMSLRVGSGASLPRSGADSAPQAAALPATQPPQAPPTTVPAPVPPTPIPASAAPTIPAAPPVLNLLPNPSFEAGASSPAGWRPLSPTFAVQDWATGVAHTGSRSVCMTGPTTAPGGSLYAVSWTTAEPVAVDPSKTYRLALWAKGESDFDASTGDYHVALWAGSPAGASVAVVMPAPSAQWAEHVQTVQVPRGATRVGIRINYVSRTAADRNRVCFDDVSLTAVP
jgi:hypothetical protein